MKSLLVLLFVFFTAASATAEHNGGTDLSTGDNASCNASFKQTCISEPTYSADSSGFAAPAGVLGSSPLESTVLSLLLVAYVVGRIHRSRARRHQSKTPKKTSSEQTDPR